MALVINDRVKETSTTTGTGTIDLAGAETGYEGFVAGVGTGNTTYYAIELNSANEWEVGIGTVTDAAPDTLSRDTIISSSNSDAAVNFSAGTKNVFCTLPAKKTISPVMDATTFVVTHNSTISEDQTLRFRRISGPCYNYRYTNYNRDIGSNLMSKVEVNQISSQCGSTLTIGQSGDTVTLACGATQSGFGRTGTVNWDTTAKTASFTAVSGNGYFVNTTSGAVTVTMPATPSAGDIVGIKDYAGTFATNNVTIARNGSNFDGAVANPTLSTDQLSVFFVYVDGTQGWKATQSDAAGYCRICNSYRWVYYNMW
jgi:hypothetical protein